MKHKKLIIISFIIIVLIIIAGCILYLKSEKYFYRDVKEINENLDVDGIKMMMDIDEAIGLIGTEVVEEGFGGDFYSYDSKGYRFSISTDSDFDQYHKIGNLTIQGQTGSLFGVNIGSSEKEFKEILIAHGYNFVEKSGYGKNTFEKNSVIISFTSYESKIDGIRIMIKERKYDGRVY